MPDKTSSYKWRFCPPEALSDEEYKRCVSLIADGGAVTEVYASRYLPKSSVIVVACTPDTGVIAGLGAIKVIRPDKAKIIAQEADFLFDPNIPELGYVVVDREFRGHGLSYGIVKRLCSVAPKTLFATTDSEDMKAPLKVCGFEQKGRSWTGNRGELSLWIKSEQHLKWLRTLFHAIRKIFKLPPNSRNGA